MHGKKGGVIERNLIEFNGSHIQFDHGVYADGDGLTVRGNVVRHNASFGLHLYPEIRNSLIADNLVYGQVRRRGIIVACPDGGGGNRIVNNTVVEDQPLAIWKGDGEVVANNILVAHGEEPIALDAKSRNVQADYNLCVPPSDRQGPHGVAGDPLFADPARGLFWLRPGSSAIGKGSAEGAADGDFWGRPRASDRPPDLGAFTFMPCLAGEEARKRWENGWAYFRHGEGGKVPDYWELPDPPSAPSLRPPAEAHTRVAIADGRWRLDGATTYPGAPAEGLLLNVRMVNAVFEDPGRPDFDPEANADEFIARIPEYVAHGVRAFTLNLQGGMPGYEGAVNSAFDPDGSLRASYMRRVRRVVESCDRHGAAVILGCFYQRQDQRLKDEDALRAAVVNVARWIRTQRFENVLLEIANEFGHGGFDHDLLKTAAGQVELIRIARRTAESRPSDGPLLVSTSGLGDGMIPDEVAAAADFLLIHFNGTPVDAIPARIAALKKFGKPIVCNEDAKEGEEGARAAAAAVASGASWGLMLEALNQRFPFTFNGALDDPIVYAKLKELASPPAAAGVSTKGYFPPPESQGGWRKIDEPGDIRRLGGMDPDKLAGLRRWLLESDDRDFAAVVIRRGTIVLEVERGNSAKTDARRVASVSKAVCATVLAIASDRSRRGLTPRRMAFDDPAFGFIPWAQPLSDPRKARITVKQLLNHTSGICPEATGAPNDGDWEYILGHSGDPRTATLSFDPGTACGYSTHALDHAALLCENVTGMPYDRFAIEALFKPLGIESWWFQYFDGGEKYGRHPSHGLGMPARDLARIAYCMVRGGAWGGKQVIPKWFVEETAEPTHEVQGLEMRFKINARTFSHGWELPALLTGEGKRSGEGIPRDARFKPGSGGQLIAFVPSLDLVVTRQTGSSGDWEYEEYLRRACAAVADRN